MQKHQQESENDRKCTLLSQSQMVEVAELSLAEDS